MIFVMYDFSKVKSYQEVISEELSGEKEITLPIRSGGRVSVRARAESPRILRKQRFFGWFWGADEAELILLCKRSFGRGEKTPQITEGIFADDHLLQVVLPGIGLADASSKWSPGDGDQLAAAILLRVCGLGHEKLHLCAGLPHRHREFMGEEQRDVAALLCQDANCFSCSRPFRLDVHLKPASKIEAVRLGQLQHCHKNFNSLHG